MVMDSLRVRTLRNVSSNPGIRAAYRRKLESLIREMHADVSKAILEEFDAASWRMARDGAWRSPSERLADKLKQVMRSWERRFRFFARNTTKGVLRQIWDRVRVGRKNELATLGIVVKVNPSRFTSELFQSLLKENRSPRARG